MSSTLSGTPRATMDRMQRERNAAAGVRADNDAELSKLDEQITNLRRKHDELVHANMEKRDLTGSAGLKGKNPQKGLPNS